MTDTAADKLTAGEILICGGTDWTNLGKVGGSKKDKDKAAEAERALQYPNLPQPTRIKNLMGIKVAFVASGSAAVHSILGTEDGQVYTFGRNDVFLPWHVMLVQQGYLMYDEQHAKGQLGLGDTVNRNMPTLLKALSGHKVVAGACGKFHSVFVTADGLSFASGSNLQGQCGSGSIKSKPKDEELLTTPHQVVNLEGKCSKVSCGAEFTMWLCEGKVFSAGMPQYGQLGHGTDHEHNTKDSSIKLAYTPQPTPKAIEGLANTVTNIACGHNHTIASDEAGLCWSWGNGGYGRLGHKEQKDEFLPRPIELFGARVKLPPDAVLGAGALNSFCTIVGGQLYAWGKLKTAGDSQMYPKPYLELAGWTIKSIACGNQHSAVAASAGTEEAAVTWGLGHWGELGLGPKGKKSSANPEKVPALDGVATVQVACGLGHTLFICDPESKAVQDAPVWENNIQEIAAANGAAGGAAAKGVKRKAEGAAKGRGKK